MPSLADWKLVAVKMIEIRWFDPNDYEIIQGQEILTAPYANYPDLLARGGPALTAVLDGQPVACGGLVRVWPGTAEGWMKVSPSATAVSTMFFRKVYRALRFWARELNLHRIQTYVDPTNNTFIRWAELLGFRVEAYMSQWGPNGEPMALYAWLPKVLK